MDSAARHDWYRVARGAEAARAEEAAALRAALEAADERCSAARARASGDAAMYMAVFEALREEVGAVTAECGALQASLGTAPNFTTVKQSS